METVDKELGQIGSLVDRGIEFSIPAKGFWERLIYGKERKFEITQLCFGALDLITEEMLFIKIDEEKVKEFPLQEADRLVREHADRIARVIAIAILNDACVRTTGYRKGNPTYSRVDRAKINSLAGFFRWRLSSKQSLEIAFIIRQLMNTGDFMSSIRLISGSIRRTTQPIADLVEDKKSIG